MAERTILNSVSSVNLYNSTTIQLNLTVADASVTHSLVIRRNSDILTLSLGSYSVGTQNVSVHFSTSQKNALLNAMSDVARFTATYYLTTLNNGSAIGQSVAEADIYISGSIAPTLGTFTYKDTNAATVAMTGDDQFIVIGQSDITFYNVSAAPYTGASIAYYRLSDNFSGNYIDVTSGGTIHYGTVDDVNLYDTGIETGFVVNAVDTRNQRSFKTVDVSGWSYYTPPFMQISGGVSRNAQDASHMDIHFKGAYSSVNGHNTVTATFKYRVTGTGAYSSEVSLPLTVSNGFECNATGLTGVNSAAFDESSVYDIVVTISDKLSSFVWEYTLPAEVPMIAFRENAIGLGAVPSNTNSLEIASGWSIVNNGKYEAAANQYYSFDSSYAINMHNSDIIGANGIYMADTANAKDEGIIFPRSNSNWDTVYAYDGEAYIRRNWVLGGSVPTGTRLLTTDDLYYKAGDTYTSRYLVLSGLVTNSTKGIRFTVTTPKRLDNISTVTVTTMTGTMRGVSGYLDSDSSNRDWTTLTTISASIRDSITVLLELDSTTAFGNVANNTPVVFYANTGFTLTFS